MKKIIMVGLIFLIIQACKDISKFSAGSYPNAETYIIDIPEEKTIHKIVNLKINSELQVPPFKWAGKETLLKDKYLKNGYFIFYIFLKESNQIIYAYVKKIDLKKAKVGLVSVQNGLSLGNWKEINKDLSKEENTKIKKIFEERILNMIR